MLSQTRNNVLMSLTRRSRRSVCLRVTRPPSEPCASCAGIEPALISTTASPRVMDASASSGGPSRAASPTPVVSTDDAPSQQVSRYRNFPFELSRFLFLFLSTAFTSFTVFTYN
ncbi:hypothetical protein ANCCAN_23532 [Ancylostoma caninum]|uniref:Uncharacterized protein n=1 Tax=Ancylostoma caninum TaxID=29170 RepID=A0A368FEX7_ANCCA|nr:hypothetical protein ANCCAN_23532 [Ancylostoma caninum]